MLDANGGLLDANGGLLDNKHNENDFKGESFHLNKVNANSKGLTDNKNKPNAKGWGFHDKDKLNSNAETQGLAEITDKSDGTGIQGGKDATTKGFLLHNDNIAEHNRPRDIALNSKRFNGANYCCPDGSADGFAGRIIDKGIADTGGAILDICEPADAIIIAPNSIADIYDLCIRSNMVICPAIFIRYKCFINITTPEFCIFYRHKELRVFSGMFLERGAYKLFISSN